MPRRTEPSLVRSTRHGPFGSSPSGTAARLRVSQIASGVGRNGAHDHTSGVPVTNFFHSTKAYKRAMNHNGRLDADKDGIACEAR